LLLLICSGKEKSNIFSSGRSSCFMFRESQVQIFGQRLTALSSSIQEDAEVVFLK
jgi:hypothetical protein